MVEFRCPQCGKKIKVNEKYIGKKGRCPDCKTVITVAQNKISDALLDFPKNKSLSETALSANNLDPSHARSIQYNQSIINQQEAPDQDDSKKQHGFFDFLLYPANLAGIVNIVFFTSLPLIGFLANYIFGMLSIGLNFIILLAKFYYYWYLTECIRCSASGQNKAPVLSIQLVDFKDTLASFIILLACGIFFIGPAIVYINFFDRFDYIYWLLVVYGLVFSPMALLAVVLYDSVSVFNPFFLIGSIISTFSNYCGLLLKLTLIGTLIWLINFTKPFLMGFPANFLSMYLVMIAAHLIGKFFCKNETNLSWDV